MSNSQNETLKCPLCSGVIKKVNNAKVPMIKCENNIYKNGEQTGCNFFMYLKPKAKQLKGYIFTKEDIATMIEGGEVNIEGIKASYDINTEYNPKLIFPPLEDF